MSLVSKNIPNLINGVSQQPASLRNASQGEVQGNGLSHIVDGLKKRPPTKFLKKFVKTNSYSDGDNLSSSNTTTLTSTEINNAFTHTYKRGEGEQYTIVILIDSSSINTSAATWTILVYDKEGNLRYESGKASWLADGTWIENNDDITHGGSSPIVYFNKTHATDAISKNLITATSVADKTYLVNKNRIVEKANSIDNPRPHEGIFYMKQMNYGKEYFTEVKNANGSSSLFSGHLRTRGGGGGSTTVVDQESQGLQTTKYFDVLLDPNTTVPDGTNGTDQIYAGGADQISSTEFSTNNLVAVRNASDPFVVVQSTQTSYSSGSDQTKAGYLDFTLEVSDDNGGNDYFAFKNTCPSFTALPKFCTSGFTIAVNGDNNKKEDNFYAQYSGSNTSGTWKECAAPSRPNNSITHSFDASTMPHILFQKSNLAFSFGRETYLDRKAGDDDTNPFPSFVDNKITDIFFHRNRLGILSDENVVFSEASVYNNFFRVTVRALLDTDVIDVGVAQNEVSLLQAAIPSQDDLVLFSDVNQFSLSSSSLLTPAEVSIDLTTKYECSLDAKPQGAGTSVFFATKNDEFSGMREYYVQSDTETSDAPAITAHVPHYIEGKITKFIASTNEDMLVCLTDKDPKTVYVYRWYNTDKERVQSSWSKWKFDSNVVDVFANLGELYFLFDDARYEVMTLNLDEEGGTVQVSRNVESTGNVGSFQSPDTVGHDVKIYGRFRGFNVSGSSLAVLEPNSQPTNGYNTDAWTSPTVLGTRTNSNIEHVYIYKSVDTNGVLDQCYEEFVVSISALTENGVTYNSTNVPESITLNGVTTNVSSYVVTTGDTYVTFNRTISESDFNNHALKTASTYTVSFNRTASSASLPKPSVLLDHRIKVTGTAITDQASLDALYDTTANTQYVDHIGNVIGTGTNPTAVYTYLAGTYLDGSGVSQNNFVHIGEPYTFKYQLSEQVYKAGEADPSRLARHQIRYVVFNYNDTGSFKVTVSAVGRTDTVTTFTGRMLGQSDNILGYSAVVEDGSMRVAVLSQAKEAEITITNDSHLPCIFQNAEVESFIHLRNRRI